MIRRSFKRSVVLVAMLAVAGTALAQAPASPSPQWQGHHQWKGAAEWRQKMEQRHMERLAVLLDLTPAQRQQVQTIFADEHSKMKTSMQQVREAMKQVRAAHEAAHQETLQRLGSVLSPAQMKKLDAIMPPRGRMGGHRMMMHGMRHGGKMGPQPGSGEGSGSSPE
jgi:hypothetical protein